MIPTDTPSDNDFPTTAKKVMDSSDLVGRTGIEAVTPRISPGSQAMVHSIRGSVGRRVEIPVRKLFVRRVEEEGRPTGPPPPLARLVSTRGRGGGVPVKLYLALIWQAAREPYDVSGVPARKWAELLDLEDPSRRGARRIKDAISRLKELNLIDVERHWGDASTLTLLNESGNGAAYQSPPAAYNRPGQKKKQQHLYFQVSPRLWTSGHLQQMSAAAVSMLLVTLAEMRDDPTTPVWWATQVFPARYGISSNMRAAGTKELIARRLLLVKKQPILNNPKRPFGRDRLRNTYQLINEAVPVSRML